MVLTSIRHVPAPYVILLKFLKECALPPPLLFQDHHHSLQRHLVELFIAVHKFASLDLVLISFYMWGLYFHDKQSTCAINSFKNGSKSPFKNYIVPLK